MGACPKAPPTGAGKEIKDNSATTCTERVHSMWSFIVYLNDHLGSCAEYIAKVGQEQEEKDIPYDSDLHVEQQSGGSRLPKG